MNKIYIHIDKKSTTYSTDGNRSVTVNVKSDEPYDTSSKLFKKYTHNITYKNKEYKGSDYKLFIYDSRAWYYLYIFSYYYPEKKVTSVELFFRLTDTSNTTPLVIGFSEENVMYKTYYTYNFLSKNTTGLLMYKNYHDNLPNTGSFKQIDLHTRLMEEYNLLVKRDNKKCVIINIGLKPTNKPVKYPDTGENREKITVSKQSDTKTKYFDNYVHKIDQKSNISSLYLNYNNDTLYLNDIIKSEKITDINVYYSNSNAQSPVAIVFKSNAKERIYKYSDFKTDLEKSNESKNLSTLKELKNDNLLNELKDENDLLDDKLSYMIEQKKEYSYKVNISSEEKVKNEDGYVKYTHTPETNYSKKSSLILFNGNKLMKKGVKNNLEKMEEIQNEIYKSITVFFGTKDPNFPLIIQLTRTTGDNNYYIHKKDKYHEYWENLVIKPDRNNEILNKLKSGELALSTSIFILINKQQKYTKDDLQHSYVVKLTTSQPNYINVEEKPQCQELKESNFKCYEHSFSAFNSLQSSSNDYIVLKLLMTNNTKGHSELVLYKTGKDDDPDVLYYSKSQNTLYVYFYGEDPRPLLVSYQNKAYIPSDLNNYFNKWVSIQGITTNICSSDNNIQLLNTLGEVSYFLNPVGLEKNIAKGESNKDYSVNPHQNITENSIKINLTAKDLNCHRVYTHVSSKKCVLGEVIHNGSKVFKSYEEYKKLTGKKSKFPDSISVYYYLYDITHSYPLLLVLEFKNNIEVNSTNKQYYKLSDRDNFEWTKIEDPSNLEDQIELEKQLKEIRNGLGIYYENKEENLIIKSADKCKEGDNSAGIAGATAAGTITVAGAGGGFLYYKYQTAILGFIRGLAG